MVSFDSDHSGGGGASLFFFQGQFSLHFLPTISISALAVRWVGLERMDFLATLLIVGLRAMSLLGLDLGSWLDIAICFAR